MPSLTKECLLGLQDDYSRFPVFIETGTCRGDTTFAMEKVFQKIYTIEISPVLFNATRELYKGDKIEFILGDSSDIFPMLLPKVSEKAIFFLDGHWSGGITGQGEKDCPLVEELEAIQNLFTSEAILVIDDYRLFTTNPGQDWTSINKEKLLAIVQSRTQKVYHLPSELAEDDRLIIHLGPR
jgi:hypothetical protein